MITLLGVGHVFDLGPRVREEVLRRQPGVVCLELDKSRLHALQTRRRRGAPPLYSVLALLQQWVAQQYGTQVGDEMLAAYEAARELAVPVALIDVDAMETWRRLRREVTPAEVLRILLSLLGALFLRRPRIERELERYRGDSAAYMTTFARQFPSVKRVVVDERNAHMASRIREMQARYGDVVAVLGDGHVEGLRELLAGENVQALRLWDLRGEASAA